MLSGVFPQMKLFSDTLSNDCWCSGVNGIDFVDVHNKHSEKYIVQSNAAIASHCLSSEFFFQAVFFEEL